MRLADTRETQAAIRVNSKKGGNLKTLFSFGLLFVIAVAALFAADQTWTGSISDSMCGASRKSAAEDGGKPVSARDGTLACVRNGAKFVFVRSGRVYNIDNQDHSGLQGARRPQRQAYGRDEGRHNHGLSERRNRNPKSVKHHSGRNDVRLLTGTRKLVLPHVIDSNKSPAGSLSNEGARGCSLE